MHRTATRTMHLIIMLFLQPPICSLVFSNIFLITLFSDSLGYVCSLCVRHYIVSLKRRLMIVCYEGAKYKSHANRRGKVRVSYILIHVF